MNAEILSIGTEILLGEITDTNATWIARQLRDIGVNVFYVTAIGDNEGRITEALRHSLSRSDLIITTGGLGPTVDDVTRQSVAAATDRELVFHQDLLDHIAARFERFGVTMTNNNRQQAYVPADAIIIENPVGTAPCYIVESESGVVISLPGVPREMKYLMEHSVLPYLREKMGLPRIIKALILRTAGIGESSLDDQIGQFMTQSNPSVGLAAHSGQTDIRITARADNEADADALIAETEGKIRALVDRHIFGTDSDSLDAVVTRYLTENNLHLAVCEAGTNGSLGAQLQRVEDSEGALTLTESYPSVADLRQQHGMMDASLRDLAAHSAQAIIETGNAKVGMAVLHENGRAGLAIRTPHKDHSRELELGSDSEAVEWAFNWGLGYIWRYLKDGA
jgi:nicotinamide-nucleotide amidase